MSSSKNREEKKEKEEKGKRKEKKREKEEKERETLFLKGFEFDGKPRTAEASRPKGAEVSAARKSVTHSQIWRPSRFTKVSSNAFY